MMTPGTLVRNKRNMKVRLWEEYVVNKCSDGKKRASMKGWSGYPKRRSKNRYLEGLALVVMVSRFGGINPSNVVGLFVSETNEFLYTWSTELVKLT